jgi:proline iminopeptidase
MPFLDVGDGHQLHWEIHGAPTGQPVVILHGGPGGGLQRWILRLFNLKKWRVLLYDQRGSGRSIPHAETRNNTTWHLVEDLEKLRKEVMRVARWTVFGGSWGSTLALAYASRHPGAVVSMILRGVYLADPAENDWIYSAAGGVARLRPQGFAAFSAEGDHCRTTRSCLKTYAKRFRNRRTRKSAVKAWNKWESDLSTLENHSAGSAVDNAFGSSAESLAILENHYFRHNCWLQKDQLLKAAATMTMPVMIVQGRYDLVCPPASAAALADALPNAQIVWTHAGHAATEPATAAALRSAIRAALRISTGSL